jgi:sterol desaturase/sphingolipid hydroxylase (fatty acid hydroxylase superfamily)
METLWQLLKGFPQGLITGLATNGIIIGLIYFFIWKKFKVRLQKFKIQLDKNVDSKQIKREIKNTIITAAVGALISTIMIYVSTKGYTQIYFTFSSHPFFSIAGFLLLLFIDDTWFYWVHRLLHHPKLFKYIHIEHHKSNNVNPFTSMSFHFAEPLLLTIWIIPVSFIMPIYAPVLGLIQVYGLLDNIKGHLGYEFYPKWWHKTWFKYFTTSTHHNMHHSKFNGNYGVHFRIWDKLLGTEFKNYEDEFEKIKQREEAIIANN